MLYDCTLHFKVLIHMQTRSVIRLQRRPVKIVMAKYRGHTLYSRGGQPFCCYDLQHVKQETFLCLKCLLAAVPPVSCWGAHKDHRNTLCNVTNIKQASLNEGYICVHTFIINKNIKI